MSNEQPDVYSDDYTSDPVAQKAAREALAATEPENRHPWVSRVLVGLGILMVVLGTIGLFIGALNTIKISEQNSELTHQNGELDREQKCISQLLINFEIEQNARGQVAADDRKAVDDIIKRVSEAKSPTDVKRAFAQYYAERKDNDQRRAKYPLPSDPGKCLSASDRTALEKQIPGSTVSPYTLAPTPTIKPTPTKKKSKAHAVEQSEPGGKGGSQLVAVNNESKASGSLSTVSNNNGGAGQITNPKPPAGTNTSPGRLLNPVVDPVTKLVCVTVLLRIVCT